MIYLLEKKRRTLIAAIAAGWISVVLILFFAATINAQVEPFSISSPPNPVGSGARAMGMGGAFVAVADDATAASWNPAGLIQLQKPEVSAVFSYERCTDRRYSSTDIDNLEDKNTIWDLNYFSLAYPFSLARRNLVFSLNYQRLYNFHREAEFAPDEFSSKGSLYTLSPAFAIQATEDLFFGLTINIWSNKWTQKSEWKNTYYNTVNKTIIREEFRDFRGVNANLGFFYRMTPKWTLGAVYKSPFRGRFNYMYLNSENPDNASGDFYGTLESIDLPPTYALGVSYRFSDAWSISFDVTRKDWNELVWCNNEGQTFGLFTVFDPNENNSVEFQKIDPTYAFRFGAEYLKILEKTVIPLRAGIFYDPIPSIGSPHSEYGVSFGSGISLGDLILDFAYQYRVRYDVPGTEIGWGYWDWGDEIFEDRKQHVFLLSGIYHF
jgi:long-subunit fatty acid transport protein